MDRTASDRDDDTTEELAALVERWRKERGERQERTHLERADFDAIRDAGFLQAAVPVEFGGTWRDVVGSVRPIASMVRLLATGDPSVALVSSMHPSVLAFWLVAGDGGSDSGDGNAGGGGVWAAQRRAVYSTAMAGNRWGTITSEPGTGGNVMHTKATAARGGPGTSLPGDGYEISGVKHFGSGLGMVDWMVTTAVPDGETEPALFVIDVHDRKWDGSAGFSLVAEWDGMGMRATQSHGMRLDAVPATRFALDCPLSDLAIAANPFIVTLFTATILGVVDEAVTTARARLSDRIDRLGAYERVQWARATQLHWLAEQALEGTISAVEDGDRADVASLRAKVAVAELAEETLTILTRLLGGGTFSLRSPFAHWSQDVRALGFLRPPWALANEQLFDTSW